MRKKLLESTQKFAALSTNPNALYRDILELLVQMNSNLTPDLLSFKLRGPIKCSHRPMVVSFKQPERSVQIEFDQDTRFEVTLQNVALDTFGLLVFNLEEEVPLIGQIAIPQLLFDPQGQWWAKVVGGHRSKIERQKHGIEIV